MAVKKCPINPESKKGIKGQFFKSKYKCIKRIKIILNNVEKYMYYVPLFKIKKSISVET